MKEPSRVSTSIQAGVLLLLMLGLGYWAWHRYHRQPDVPTHEGKTIARWIEDLKDPDYSVSDKAADALVRAGPDALPALLAARASNDDIRLHRRAAAALVRIGAPAVPGLLAALKTGARDRAETALVRIGPDAVPALVEALKEEANGKEAAHVLGLIGPRAAAAVPPLIEAVQTNKGPAGLREEAVTALGTIGTPAGEIVPVLTAALKDRSGAVRQRAAEALGAIGPPAREAVPALAAALKDDQSDVASAACTALGRIHDAGGAVPLLKAFQGNRGNVAEAAGRALWQLGPEARGIVPALVPLLKGSEKDTMRIRNLLFSLGPSAVPGLTAALRDTDAGVRQPAAEVLGTIGPAARENRETVSALVTALKDKESRVALEAARALAQIDPSRAREAVPLLSDSLDSVRAADNSRAAEALAEMGPDARAAVPNLIKALKVREGVPPVNRALAQIALARIGPAAAPALRAALKDKSEGVAPLSAEALGHIYPPRKEAVSALLDALKQDRAHAEAYVLALGRIGLPARDALPVLAPLLDDEGLRAPAAFALVRIDPEQAKTPRFKDAVLKDLQLKGPKAAAANRREKMILALMGMGRAARPVVPVLAELLKEKEWAVRALHALHAIGPGAIEAVPALLALARDRNQNAALLVAEVLKRIGAGAVPALANLLKDSDPQARLFAANILKELGPAAREALTPLLHVLRDPAREVRAAAAEAVGNIGPDARDAVPDLIDALSSWDTDLRSKAARALGLIGSAAREARRPLLECALDPSPDVRRWAIKALGAIDPKYTEAVPAVRAALHDSSPLVRLAAADALSCIDREQGKEAGPTLLALCNSPTPLVRSMAVDGLLQIAPERAKEIVPALLADLNGESSLIRLNAAAALVKIEPERSLQVVLVLMGALRDQDPRVRLKVIESLGLMGAKAREAVPALAGTLQYPFPPAPEEAAKALREEAVKALKKIDPDALKRAGIE